MESATVKDAGRIRAIAAVLLDKAVDDSSIDRAAQLLKLASETENQVAQAAKYAVEEQKLKDDLSDSSSRRRSEERKTNISILTPLFTTVVLAGTLILQSYQFKEQRIDAANVNEDVRWNEAIKVLSTQKQLSPAGVLLATFSESPRYGGRARDLAEQLLTNSTSRDEFSAVFSNFFEPVDWLNLKWILAADRSIWGTEGPLSDRSWNKDKGENDTSLLTESERAAYAQLKDEVLMLGNKVGPLLKGPRPRDVALDLHATAFWTCDWKGADLSGADLMSSHLFQVDLDGANLSEITRFGGANFQGSTWWKAAMISPQLLNYLLNDETSRYSPGFAYGSTARPISQADYDAALMKLKKASSIP